MAENIFEIPAVKTGIVYPETPGEKASLNPEQRLEETVRLAAAINLEVAFAEIVRLRQIRPDAYFGKGVIGRFREAAAAGGVELLIVDAALTPIQQRNLEKALDLKVIDRTALILEIFGERAQTREGSLQVELAHLTYQRSRLVRSWTHLERQRGGAGFLGGPGETQIELDRRIIDEKITKIKKRWKNQTNPRPSAYGAKAGAVSGGGTGRLYQHRQVHIVQPPDQSRRFCRKSAVCHTRPDHAPH